DWRDRGDLGDLASAQSAHTCFLDIAHRYRGVLSRHWHSDEFAISFHRARRVYGYPRYRLWSSRYEILRSPWLLRGLSASHFGVRLPSGSDRAVLGSASHRARA